VDLIHAEELAKLLVYATKFENDEVFDGGTGKGESVLSVAKEVSRIVGRDPLIQFLPMRRGEEPTHIVANEQGWVKLPWSIRPQRRSLQETVDWYGARTEGTDDAVD